MKVKMLTTYAGPTGTCLRGKHINLPEKEAKSLLKGGYALPVVSTMPEEVKPKAMPEEVRKTKILDAVGIIIQAGDDEQLIASGAPSVEALEELLGFDITSAERDDAYSQIG